MKLKFAELHKPLFLAGTNLGEKLDIGKRTIELVYDRDHQELQVTYNAQTAIVPVSNVASMTPMSSGALEEQAAPKAIAAPLTPIKAQVSTPQDHVFKTGSGKKRD